MTVLAREGTVVTLSGRRVGIGNIWARRDLDRLTATLHFEDDTTLEAVEGTVLELGDERWRVATVREGHPHGEVSFEAEAG